MDIDDDENLTDATIAGLKSVARQGLPEESLLLYARWWQLEEWIRQLAYVELRSKHGVGWKDGLGASYRQDQDAEWTHMLGRDNENPLAYLDFSRLAAVVEEEWEIFAASLLRRETWSAHIPELLRVRHRIAHFRSPHRDDLGRLEQFLRDLERGAFTAVASYNRRYPVGAEEMDDAVPRGWLLHQHPDADRLIEHAARQYEVDLELTRSRRPWSSDGGGQDRHVGRLWHASFYSRRREINLAALWRHGRFRIAKDYLLYLEAESPNWITLTFSAGDDGDRVADAIGGAFDSLLMTLRPGNFATDDQASWCHQARQLSYRITAASAWTTVDESTVPISMFSTGGAVDEPPDW